VRRLQAHRPERVRVELRLQPAIAEKLYAWAEHENLSLSDAGNRLIKTGLAQQPVSTKTTGPQVF
jgi:hypothetical protein